MALLVAIAAAAAVVALWIRSDRERGLAAAAIATLEEQVRTLSMRVDVVEHDAVAASAHAEIAETVLLEKGYADHDDLEAARRRLEADGAPGARGDEMH